MVIKAQFIIQDDAKLPEAVNSLYSWAIDGDGAERGGEFMACVLDEFLCFGDIEEEVTVCTTLGEVGNRLVICCN